MTVRLTMVTPALDQALREARFPGPGSGQGLDGAGERAARAAAFAPPPGARLFTGPSRRCRETARALGLDAEPLPALADWDAGSWAGRTLAEVAAAEPEAVARWLAEPGAAPHGGESLEALRARVGEWVRGVGAASPDAVTVLTVVAEVAVVRAVLVEAVGLPSEVFWRLDVPPLTRVELSGRAGRWNLRCGAPL
ncbi:histidine phosphatase family protein [Streptomyces sp. NPDC057638]|uniref:histidine phosphatase family protein n=1 Tax=Streptomyces sp. NPDC057638 TaxID=3346190 RepID=UPI0036B43ACE